LRWRIGDRVVSARAGSFEAEEVQLSQITATVDSLDDVDKTADVVKTLLEKFHTNVDYEVIVPKELLRQAQVLQMMFNVLLVLIASIALLVGGIGIMNIMLATVTERTREIGIRKAIGAPRDAILYQFLMEAFVISGTGAIIGIGIALAIPAIANFVLTLFPEGQGIHIPVSGMSVIMAFLVSCSTGLLFGYLPANRAAQLHPTESLRYE
jgi:putative ABC transport system permease protein